MTTFKPGDTVICVDANNAYNRIIVDNEYIIECVYDSSFAIKLVDINVAWSEHRFKLSNNSICDYQYNF